MYHPLTLFNDVIKAICQGVLASCEEAPAVECVLLAQETDSVADDLGTDTGTDLSQVDWPAEQTNDPTISVFDKCSNQDISLPSTNCTLTERVSKVSERLIHLNIV